MTKQQKKINNPQRIVVVDDDPDIIEFISAILEDKYDIFCFLNGQDAVDNIMDIEPDLLILDAVMPAISGYELSDAIRANPLFKEIPIIMLSVLDTMKDHRTGYRHGVSLYLTKPVEPEILLKNIEIELIKLGGPYPKKKSTAALRKNMPKNS
jgi:putative two-component system response regulator